MASTALAPRPAHVPSGLVIDFDWFSYGTASDDLQWEWEKLRAKAPNGIFWTPRNGGHWVPLGGEDVATVLSDHTRFSARDIYIPANTGRTAQLLPNESDPPEQRWFRKVILPPLLPRNLQPLEDKARALTRSLIGGIVDRGECEFVADFASVLPIVVFLDLMDLPREDRFMLRELGERVTRPEVPEQRLAAQKQIEQYLLDKIGQRRREPAGDLLSAIATAEVGGRPITDTESTMLSVNVLLGGLDTVVNMLGFFALFLARNPGHRRQLTENPELVKPAVEELIRRYGIVTNGRRVVQDTKLSGAQLRTGDMILASTFLPGTDAALNQDPLTVDFTRAEPKHATFGTGNHACPGQHLARRELMVFLEEWLRAIPEFEVKPASDTTIGVGHVAGLRKLELRWPPNGLTS